MKPNATNHRKIAAVPTTMSNTTLLVTESAPAAMLKSSFQICESLGLCEIIVSVGVLIDAC